MLEVVVMDCIVMQPTKRTMSVLGTRCAEGKRRTLPRYSRLRAFNVYHDL